MYTNIYNCSVSANCEMTPRCQAQKSLFTYTYHTRNKTWKIFVLQKLIKFLLPLPSAVQAKEMKGFI